MVFKLSVVILALLVITNGEHRFNIDTDPVSFYKYNFLKHLTFKRDGETETNEVTSQKPGHIHCPSYMPKCNINLPHKISFKRALKTYMDYQDFLRSLPHEIMTDEYEDNVIEK
ncbi:uncharacterized protein LOC125236990 [Leguminivora glycinivorella]|uniref:uncharacterized protein LOC125236990 n=1 Tax=Leguminivora glycinivorella TaxID=1035111 RepID=UPI00200E400D|nr:uncharacterized protein LOC125236990 [Leguminivora glycinivorella]